MPKHPNGADPLLVILNYYSYAKMQGKNVFIRNIKNGQLPRLSMEEIKDVILKSNLFKICECESQEGEVIELVCPLDTDEETSKEKESEFIGFLVIDIIFVFQQWCQTRPMQAFRTCFGHLANKNDA